MKINLDENNKINENDKDLLDNMNKLSNEEIEDEYDDGKNSLICNIK